MTHLFFLLQSESMPYALIFLYLFAFNVDCITYLLLSFDVLCFGAVIAVFAVVALMRGLCRKMDEAADVDCLSSSLQPLVLMLTAPLFNRLSSSWPFCRMICPFSVRAPRIKIILLDCCWCCWCCWWHFMLQISFCIVIIVQNSKRCQKCNAM